MRRNESDPRASGEPHYFVRPTSGDDSCVACKKPLADPVHKREPMHYERERAKGRIGASA